MHGEGINIEMSARRTRRPSRQHGAMESCEAPVDLDEVRRYRAERQRAELRKRDYAAVLMFVQVNTRYATDATNMQVWCSHYETRCVFVATEGPVILFDYGNYPHLAEGIPTIDEYRVNSSFYYFTAGSRSDERADVDERKLGEQLALPQERVDPAAERAHNLLAT